MSKCVQFIRFLLFDLRKPLCIRCSFLQLNFVIFDLICRCWRCLQLYFQSDDRVPAQVLSWLFSRFVQHASFASVQISLAFNSLNWQPCFNPCQVLSSSTSVPIESDYRADSTDNGFADLKRMVHNRRSHQRFSLLSVCGAFCYMY